MSMEASTAQRAVREALVAALYALDAVDAPKAGALH